MNIIFFGTPDFVIPVAQELKDNFNLVAVVTTPDQPAGRKHILTPSPVKLWAEKNNIPVLQPESLIIHHTSLLTHDVDLFVVAAYGKILPETLLQVPRLGAMNIHPSRLPQFRGPTPIQESILHGLTDSAVSVIQMDKEVDHGPLLAQIPFRLEKTDTTEQVLQKVFRLAAENICQTIHQFNNVTIIPITQNHSQATYCRMISKQDGYVDMDRPPSPELFDRMIRAYYPWPAVWTQIRIKKQESKIKFLPEKKIQLEGKNPVDLEIFYRGYPELKGNIEKLYD